MTNHIGTHFQAYAWSKCLGTQCKLPMSSILVIKNIKTTLNPPFRKHYLVPIHDLLKLASYTNCGK